MESKLNETGMSGLSRGDEELAACIESVKIGMGKSVMVAGIAPDLALNLGAIHDFMVELQWVRGKLREVRKSREAKERGNE